MWPDQDSLVQPAKTFDQNAQGNHCWSSSLDPYQHMPSNPKDTWPCMMYFSRMNVFELILINWTLMCWKFLNNLLVFYRESRTNLMSARPGFGFTLPSSLLAFSWRWSPSSASWRNQHRTASTRPTHPRKDGDQWFRNVLHTWHRTACAV